MVDQVRYLNDTLLGVATRGADVIAVAVGDIVRLQTRRFDPAKTVGLVACLALLTAVASAVVADAFDDARCGIAP